MFLNGAFAQPAPAEPETTAPALRPTDLCTVPDDDATAHAVPDLSGILSTLYGQEFTTSRRMVTRAELMTALLNGLQFERRAMSDFPFYRDVPLNHWAYNCIELGRERRLVRRDTLPTPGGFFQPDEAVSRLEAFRVFAAALTGSLPGPDISRDILARVNDATDIPSEDMPAVAKLVSSRVLLGALRPTDSRPTETSAALQPNAPLTVRDMAAMLNEELRVARSAVRRLPVAAQELPWLAGGMNLSLIPSSALFRSEMKVGNYVFFSLEETVTGSRTDNGEPVALMKGSRLRGEISGIRDDNTFLIHFHGVRALDDQIYRLNALLPLSFPGAKNDLKDTFIVPGEPYTVTTTDAPPPGTPPALPETGNLPATPTN
ncbi:MAG: hypothetical protein AB7P76_05955 [Candidatus Melainabacteria bacterium]